MAIGKNDAVGRQAIGKWKVWITTYIGRKIMVDSREDITSKLRRAITANTRENTSSDRVR